MRIVGVVDLASGYAVHATGGVRANYRPVARAGQTQIDGDPERLAAFYRDVCGLTDVYVADLDVITGGTLQRQTIGEIATGVSRLWLDAGVASVDDAGAALRIGAERVVVGLETLPDLGVLTQICAGIDPTQVVLSIDLRAGEVLCRSDATFRGDSVADVARQAADAGLETMIVLDVMRVGGSDGPAMRDIERVREAVPDVAVYAGGGVGSVADLKRLEAAGAAGALIASALHDGRLTPAEIHPILTR